MFLFLCTGGEQLLKMIVDVTTIFNDIPSSCYPENENAKGASWAERMENMDSLWEGVRESVYDNFLSKQAYPLVIQCDNCSQSLSGGRAIRCLTCKKHYCGDCDFSFHAQQPFHNRWLVSSDSWYSLKTMEFVDSTGKLVEKGTTVFSHLIAFKLLFIILFQMFQSPVLNPINVLCVVHLLYTLNQDLV